MTDHATATIRPLGQPGDLGWVTMVHGEVYASEFGWGATFENLVARIVADYADEHDAVREGAWIAEIDGRRVGSIFCVAADDHTAKLRLLLVLPEGRGHDLGRRLVQTCIDFARSAGYDRMTLWTTSNLGSARRIYRGLGFELTASSPNESFGEGVTDETWERALCSSAPADAVHGPDDAEMVGRHASAMFDAWRVLGDAVRAEHHRV